MQVFPSHSYFVMSASRAGWHILREAGKRLPRKWWEWEEMERVRPLSLSTTFSFRFLFPLSVNYVTFCHETLKYGICRKGLGSHCKKIWTHAFRGNKSWSNQLPRKKLTKCATLLSTVPFFLGALIIWQFKGIVHNFFIFGQISYFE